MKNIKNLIGLLLMAAIIGFTSCSEDDDDVIGPSISFFGGDFIDGDYIAAPGETLQFSWLATQGDAKLESFSVTKESVTLEDYVEPDIPKDNYQDTLSTDAPLNVGSYIYAFKVTDKDGETASKSFTITVEEQASDIETYSSTTIVSAYLAATAGSQYMDATTGTTYRHDATGSENATFGFISGGGSGAVILASGTSLSLTQKPSGWSNAAKLATTNLTGSEFDAISDETALLDAMPSSINSDEIKNLQDGETNDNVTVIAFDDNGTKGLIKLPASLNNDQDQSITIDVKVQQ